MPYAAINLISHYRFLLVDTTQMAAPSQVALKESSLVII